MPAKFDHCVKRGGRVRTLIVKGKKHTKGAKYLHVCYSNGKAYAGNVQTTKKRK